LAPRARGNRTPNLGPDRSQSFRVLYNNKETYTKASSVGTSPSQLQLPDHVLPRS
jgi:hypothetical protein